MAKQSQMFEDEPLDPVIAQAADRLVELLELKRSTKEKLDIQERNLIGLMNKNKKPKIRHAGRIIELSHIDERTKLKVKKAKKSKRKPKK